ncbi:MAG: hypothetical protein JXB18_09510 [Sedimentisphaerales bacterium]|nr:hypothetical protein [Sedimentisphaerales bacterium]
MHKLILVILGLPLYFCGCGGIPKDALSMNPTTLKDRQLQTRLYDTKDEKMVLSACAALLQDIGFNLDESETELGLIVSSKDRGAVDAGQVTAAIMASAILGTPCTYDKKQKIRASVVTTPSLSNENKISVRVTFQRVVWNNYGEVVKLERLNDPVMYEGFFEKLSKAIFLEAQGL